MWKKIKNEIVAYTSVLITSVIFGGGIMLGVYGIACILDILTK